MFQKKGWRKRIFRFNVIGKRWMNKKKSREKKLKYLKKKFSRGNKDDENCKKEK